MFEIKFRVTQNMAEFVKLSVEEIDNESDLVGFFELNFNGNHYGYYHDEELKEGEEGFDLISRWFEDLLQVCVNLNDRNYVAVSDIESFCSWLEFRRIGLHLKVSLIETEDKVGYQSVVIEPIASPKFSGWSNVEISFEEFKNELFMKARLYIEQLTSVTPKFLETNRIKRIMALLEQAIA